MLQEGEVYVSHDEIRFSMVAEDEPYFSKEDEVFETFVHTIVVNLRDGKTVYADATHLNAKSRLKLLNEIEMYLMPHEIEIICMKTPLELCLERNENRKGTRAYVPQDVIRKMHRAFSCPHYYEIPVGYSKIWIKEPDTAIYILNEGE
jgi:predicted kinase